MEWALMPFRRYAEFSGRSRRKEYWSYILLTFVAVIVLSVVETVVGQGRSVGGMYGPLTALFLLGTIIPSIAVAARRLHDQDKSAWFLLLGLIPLVNLILLVFMFLDGTPGPNRFGPDPKAGERVVS